MLKSLLKSNCKSPSFQSLFIWLFLLLITLISLTSTFPFPISSNSFSGTLTPSPPITKSRPFNQCFSTSKTPTSISGIELIFATYNRENQGDLTFNFREKNSLFPFYSTTIPANTLKSNTPEFIPIKNSPQTSNLCLNLTSTNPNSSTSPSIWLSETSLPYRLHAETSLLKILFTPTNETSFLISFFSVLFLTILLKFTHDTIRGLIS